MPIAHMHLPSHESIPIVVDFRQVEAKHDSFFSEVGHVIVGGNFHKVVKGIRIGNTPTSLCGFKWVESENGLVCGSERSSMSSELLNCCCGVNELSDLDVVSLPSVFTLITVVSDYVVVSNCLPIYGTGLHGWLIFC